jgi:putative transposase
VPTSEHLQPLREVIRGVCANFDADLVEKHGNDERVHLLVNYPSQLVWHGS